MAIDARWNVVLFLILGNLVSLYAWLIHSPIGVGPPYIALAVVIYVIMYVRYARAMTPSLKRFRSTFRVDYAIASLVAGVILTLPALVPLIVPDLVGPIHYGELSGLSERDIVLRILFYIPFVTALPEEMLFRKYVFENQVARGAIALTATNCLIFTAWHVVVSLRTVFETNLADRSLLIAASYAGSLFSILIGGVVFCAVRLRTGSFVYAWLTHSVTDAILNVAVWLS